LILTLGALIFSLYFFSPPKLTPKFLAKPLKNLDSRKPQTQTICGYVAI